MTGSVGMVAHEEPPGSLHFVRWIALLTGSRTALPWSLLLPGFSGNVRSDAETLAMVSQHALDIMEVDQYQDFGCS